MGEFRGALGWINPAGIIVCGVIFLRRNKLHFSANAPKRGANIVPKLRSPFEISGIYVWSLRSKLQAKKP